MSHQNTETDFAAALGPRLAAGERLSDEEIGALASSPNLLSLGTLADEVRRHRHGDHVTFVRVAEIPIDAAAIDSQAIPPAAGEVRLVGAPSSIESAVRQVQMVSSRVAGKPLTGFALHELDALCGGRVDKLIRALVALREAGLTLVSELAWDRTDDPRRALAAAAGAELHVARMTIHRTIPSGAFPLLLDLRRLGSLAKSVRALAPLAREVASSTGYDDMRLVALARVIADGIGSIQVDWGLYGPKLAQVALTFGADDLDNVSPWNTQDLGARRAPLEEVRRNIKAASFLPLERNGCFERIAP